MCIFYPAVKSTKPIFCCPRGYARLQKEFVHDNVCAVALWFPIYRYIGSYDGGAAVSYLIGRYRIFERMNND